MSHTVIVYLHFSRVESSVDRDQMAWSEANWLGSTVFSKRVNPGLACQGLIFNPLVLLWKIFIPDILFKE